MSLQIGSTGLITVNSSVATMTTTTPLTVSAWLNVQSTGGGGLGRIIGRAQGAASVVGMRIYTMGTTQFAIAVDDNSGTATGNFTQTTAIGSYSLNTWFHLCATWTGVNNPAQAHFYVNGVETSYGTNTTMVGTVGSVTGQPSHIGNRYDGVRNFDGSMADIAVWSVVLSAAQRNSLSKGFSPRMVQPQNLTLFSRFIRNIQDVRGAGYTTSGTTTVTAHPRIYS